MGRGCATSLLNVGLQGLSVEKMRRSQASSVRGGGLYCDRKQTLDRRNEYRGPFEEGWELVQEKGIRLGRQGRSRALLRYSDFLRKEG